MSDNRSGDRRIWSCSFGRLPQEQEIQALEDLQIRLELGDDFALPETVNAVMSDNSRTQIPVSWSVDDETLSAWLSKPGSHEIQGQAEGHTVKLSLTVEGVNLLDNPSFEDGADDPWVVENLGGCDQLMLEQKAGDSRTGEWHYHFWSADADKVEFTLEQRPEALEPGAYRYTVYIMGGDCGEAEVYAYVKLDGEIVERAPMEITVWNEWHPGSVEFDCAEGQEVTVGIYVKAPAAGAWGKIDDASLSLR